MATSTCPLPSGYPAHLTDSPARIFPYMPTIRCCANETSIIGSMEFPTALPISAWRACTASNDFSSTSQGEASSRDGRNEPSRQRSAVTDAALTLSLQSLFIWRRIIPLGFTTGK